MLWNQRIVRIIVHQGRLWGALFLLPSKRWNPRTCSHCSCGSRGIRPLRPLVLGFRIRDRYSDFSSRTVTNVWAGHKEVLHRVREWKGGTFISSWKRAGRSSARLGLEIVKYSSRLDGRSFVWNLAGNMLVWCLTPCSCSWSIAQCTVANNGISLSVGITS